MNELDTAVVEGDASAAVADEASKPKPQGTPKWETKARDRLRAAIRRYSKPLADLVAREPMKATPGCWSQISCAMAWGSTSMPI